MINLQINNRQTKQMKEMGFFGDYILAKRLQPTFRYSTDTYLSLKRFIDNALRWAHTPQGYKFWQNIYRNLNI